jgi:hypothetical protein
MWDGTPATIRQVAARTSAGGWVPGDRAPWLEFFGKVYGWVIAVPVTAAAFIGCWLVQRPSRVVLAVLCWWFLRWAL